MSFGNILNQILKDGLGGGTQTRDRVQTSADNLDHQGGVGGILAQLQGALSGAGGNTTGAGGALGGFGEKAKDFMRADQVGGLSGGQIGGIGALAGALLGGGIGGAARGGAMAVLGTLALGALKKSRAAQTGQGIDAGATELDASPAEVETLTSPQTERLLLRAMIGAAKADGQIDQGEMEKIIGKLDGDAVTAEEKAFVMTEMRAPADPAAIAADVSSQAQAAEIYAASIIAISIDTDKEREYLRTLATALRLDPATVAQLHQMTGAPTV